MFAYCLLLAALISTAFSPSTRSQRDVAWTTGATIVERLRSELASPPTSRRGTACWWLWILSGTDVCVNRVPNTSTLERQSIFPQSIFP